MNRIHKIAACFMIGTMVIAGKSTIARADEVPIAGIDMTLNDIYQDGQNDQIDISKYLPSDYANLGFANVTTNYVNIRSKASENSKILGKLYSKSA
ncbi:MAG TPA: hypothetical protein VN131_03045, partial [Mobilitalea sp.]|nr:hypothetical protein [Mobilitalea sp.]